MKIDKTFKIKEKYFNAILRLEKPFELRHEKVEPNSVIKLECENGRYIIFKSGVCNLSEYDSLRKDYKFNFSHGLFYLVREGCIQQFFGQGDYNYRDFDWYDTFCWEYINKAPTYLIEIAEILEVK